MVSAGEISGDMHAAAVLKKLRAKEPELEIFGMGGPQLKAMGAEILIDPTAISTIGYLEAFKNLKEHFAHLKKMKNLIKLRKPDLVFLVDYSAFNMRLAKACRELGVKAVNYFPPSAWLYNRRRAKKMAAYGTKIAAVFPMEKEVYQEAGAEVSFVGHPLLDLVKVESETAELKAKYQLKEKEQVISLFPGSRKGEIDSLLTKMLEAAAILKQKKSKLKIFLAAAAGIEIDYLLSFVRQSQVEVEIVESANYELMQIADFIITASGTTTLEAAILQTPQLVCYQAAWSSYFLAKYIFKIEFVALPNIIYGSQIVPELLQNDFETAELVEIALDWLNNQHKLNKIEAELQTVREKLGGGGAVNRTADLLLQEGGLKNSG